MPITYVGPGITRLDLEDTHNHGFMVRIFRVGKRYSAYFSDLKCGGKRKAKKMAQNCYDEMVAKYGPANRRGSLNKVSERNSSGVVGVHIATSTDTRWSGETYKAYCASWTVEGNKRKKLAFSWKKYGKKKALEYAIQARDMRSTNRAQVIAAADAKSKKSASNKKSALFNKNKPAARKPKAR